MTKIKRLLRNKKALSPVLSTILMIVIVVIGMTIAFGFFVNYVRDFQAGRGSSVLELIQMEDVWFKSTTTSIPRPHNPTSYNYLGATLPSGTVSDLNSSNNQYMTFRSYGTAFSPLVSDYVDQVSNVDGVADIGTHSDYTKQQSAPDSSYDILTESDTNGGGTYLEQLWVTGFTSADLEWTEVGSSPYLGAIDYPSNYFYTATRSIRESRFTYADSVKTVNTLSTVQICLYAYGAGDDQIEVSVWDGSANTVVGSITPTTTWAWYNQTCTTILNTWTKVQAAGLRVYSVRVGSTMSEVRVDASLLRVTSLRPYNYELDLEVQWTNADYDETNESLCIFPSTLGSENLKVDVRSGLSWITVINALQPNTWNNVSVSSYLTSATFTIRFKGSVESGDTTQHSWQIDCTLLYTGLTPTEYTSEVEFTGPSDSLNWFGLDWKTECGWTVDGVNVTIQLYDWTVDSYPQSGDGYFNYNNGTANIDQTYSLNIATDSARFKNLIDQSWKVKIKGVKSTSTLFDLNVDWIELYPQAREGYPIETWLYNYGKIDTTVSSVYINGLSVDFTSATIKIGEHSKTIIYLSNPWTPGTAYKIKLVTERGSVFEGEYVSPVTS